LFGNSDQGNFDTEKLELVKIQNVIIEDLERDSVPIEKVSEEEVAMFREDDLSVNPRCNLL
jgi:hypothetical protein